LSAAHPLALARWLSGGDPAGPDIGRATLDGRLKLIGGGVTVSEAELGLGEARGEGVLSAQWDGRRPLLRGTVDFEDIAMARGTAVASLPALVQFAATPAAMRAADVDMRLSTERLRIETVDLSQVAATIVVKDGQLT
ncbi:hypothetical protein J8J40_22920, partial [Mycobacterium tuberculosis]|nr:hypothetical protein [Mycobacterium tuberculosis]